MPDPELPYYGTTKQGKILLPSDKIRKEVASVFPDCDIEVIFRRRRKRTSDRQGRYYWGCIVQAFLSAFRDFDPEIGWTAEMVHEELKRRFLPLVREWGQTVIPTTGEVIPEPMTTTKLSTGEREDYHAHCRKWGDEMDIIIALPNEQAEIMFQP